jgi:hypothetical protein
VPIDPGVVVDFVAVDRHVRVVDAGTEEQDVVGDGRADPAPVLVLLHEQQRLRVRADGLRLRVLIDADLAVVDEAVLGVVLDEVAAEVLQADVAVEDLLGRYLSAVHADDAAGLHNPA